MSILDECPVPPDWKLDWDGLRRRYEWVDNLHDCPQDPGFHAEGDVGIHTRLACDALLASTEFRRLPEAERRIVFAAVLMHDIAKPACTKLADGRISSRGHSRRGENMARRILWRQGVPFRDREAVCGLIRYHQVPFFLLDRPDSRRVAHAVSYAARCDHLALVAWADAEGRHCAKASDKQHLLDQVALFPEYCEEEGCLSSPRRFASDHARFLYFRGRHGDPDECAYDDTCCEVTLMSGLPGAGKDTWIRKNAGGVPVVSLDAIRADLEVDAAGPQGRVLAEARARAKEHLRQRRSFIWNATNLSRQIRASLISLFAAYNARISIVYLEAAEAETLARNRRRESPLPRSAIERMLERWDVPQETESHRLTTSIFEPTSRS